MSVPKELISEGLTFEEKNKIERKDDSGAAKTRTEPNFPKESTESDTSQEDIKPTSTEKTNVSSTAIVKYSLLEPPVLPYAKVEKDTDLRIAPSNWLRDGRFSDLSSGKSGQVELTSFGMAHSFPEVISDVDVISDAENIKKLLKIPYSKAEVSLAVHRVGRTTLLDELDIPSLLLYASEREDVQLRWLYEFYCEQLNIPKDTSYLKKKKNKNQTKLKDIFSKFLHYSIQNQPAYTDSSIADVGQTHQEAITKKDSSGCTDEARAATETIVPGKDSKKQRPGTRETRPQVIPISEQEHIIDSLPEPQQTSAFQRHVLWKFEDIHMLIGSNMPIFGGGKYPAVSLRLRECGKPINVLTGLDYWLDNLMCNVPEVAMCYHLDGIVQFYDLYKTEELPDLKGSQFSPKVVKDIAQNLLSFLKSNCTQEGHTYWLFKGSENDVVKLYDLTSICDQEADDKYQNPFTVPVAMLFYRVAKNMMKQTALSSTDQGTIRLLLSNCLILLDGTKYPEIITSANYLLSDLYSPDDLHTLSALSSRASEEDECSRNEECGFCNDDIQTVGRIKPKEETLKSLEVRKLSTPGMFQDDSHQMARPLPGNIEERCRAALAHIVKGLVSLRLARNFEGEEQQDTYAASGSNVTQKSPDTSPISSTSSNSLHATEKKASLSENSDKASREDSGINQKNEKFQEVRDGDETFSKAVVPRRKRETKFYHKDLAFLSVLVPVKWEGTSAALLLRKASSVYHSLAFASVSKGKYGRSLRYCKMALRCFGSYKSLTVDCEGAKDSLLSSILCSCGDAYLMLAKCKENLAVHQEDYKFKSKDDTFIAEFARQHRGELYEVCSLRIEFVLELEGNLSKSASLYEAAIDVTPEDTNFDKLMSLTRRVGNVRNELGVYYMNCAVCTMDSGNCPSAQEQDLLKKSYTCFEKGIQAFQAIEDEPNVALLLSNTGRLMRMCAQAVGGTSRGVNKKERGEFSAEERVYFNRAIESYQKALRCLSERKCCPEVWDTVTWELSGAYYTMATLLQDFAPLARHSQEEVEKEVTQLMMKALKLCEHIGADHSQILQGSGNCKNVPGTQYIEQLEHRLGSIHHRLASLYHNSYRNQVGDQTKKKAKTLAELHYLKTSTYFKPEKYPCQAIRIQLERVAMCEYYISIHGGFTATIKTLQQALDFILSTEKALKTLAEGRIEDQRQSINSGSTDFESQELKSLLPILENRLYGVLKELVKVHSQRKGKTKLPADLVKGMEKAKHLYSVALRASSNKKTDLELPGKCEHLAQILHALRETRDDNNKT